MSAGAVPSNEYLIETVVLDSNAASVTFSNLGQFAGVYQHLQLVMATRSASATEDYLYLRINGDTGSSYRGHFLEGNGSSVLSGTEATTQIFLGVNASGAIASGGFSGFVTDILEPFKTTKNTTVRTLGGVATRSIALSSGLWMNTASITSLTIKNVGANNLLAGSRFSLYGVN
jgi:hypothetical protein